VAKQMVHRHMVQPDIDAVVAEENRNIARAYKAPAHKEAVTAFLEKRQPRFNQ
jgi:enoyl-CoA hydratase/carnithine racemase